MSPAAPSPPPPAVEATHAIPPTAPCPSPAPASALPEGEQSRPLHVYSRRCRGAAGAPSAETPSADTPPPPDQHPFVAKLATQVNQLLPPPPVHKRRNKAPPSSIPRRSRRVAGASPCSPGPIVTDAQKRIIRNLGCIEDSAKIDHKAQDEYFRTLDQPLTEACLAAVAAIFGLCVEEGPACPRIAVQ
ncbi:hypothetical protein BS78_07G142800 [Paspalum vaginatum]|nr:hypothetical protein BS78_07G142800 [Paspalum vaginatum]